MERQGKNHGNDSEEREGRQVCDAGRQEIIEIYGLVLFGFSFI